MSVEFQDLLDLLHAEAIANTLSPTEASVYRTVCRSYSKKFNTPLHVVFELDPEIVILNVYEEKLDAMDTEDGLEDLIDTIRGIQDPAYEEQKVKEQDEFDKRAEEEEAARVKAGRPIHSALKNMVSLKETVSENGKNSKEKLPIGGSLDLSHMSGENDK